MAVLGDGAPPVLQEYYTVLTGGIENYGDGARLVELLAGDFDFEGPLAGHHVGAASFASGVAGFVATVRAIDVLRETHDRHGSAIIYDATMPAGVTRFAEFFGIDNGILTSLRLLYDPADYVAKGGR